MMTEPAAGDRGMGAERLDLARRVLEFGADIQPELGWELYNELTRLRAENERLQMAHQKIVALDLGKTPSGRNDLYTGPDRFFKAHAISSEVCAHKWVGKQMGGSPADAASYEWVCYCEYCGTEKPDDA